MKRILDFALGALVGTGVLALAGDIPFKTATTTVVSIDPENIEFSLAEDESATLSWPKDSRTIKGQAGRTVKVNAVLRARAE